MIVAYDVLRTPARQRIIKGVHPHNRKEIEIPVTVADRVIVWDSDKLTLQTFVRPESLAVQDQKEFDDSFGDRDASEQWDVIASSSHRNRGFMRFFSEPETTLDTLKQAKSLSWVKLDTLTQV